jgi:hypothetical protein
MSTPTVPAASPEILERIAQYLADETLEVRPGHPRLRPPEAAQSLAATHTQRKLALRVAWSTRVEAPRGETQCSRAPRRFAGPSSPKQVVPVSVASSGAVGGDLACTDSSTSRVRPVLGVPRKLARPER